MRRAVALVSVIAGLGLSASPAVAAVFPVNSTEDTDDTMCTTDPGGCTLREGIDASNDNGATESDQIPISVTGIINLQSALPEVSTPATISGPGQQNLTIRRANLADFVVMSTAPPLDTIIRIEGVRLTSGSVGLSAGGSGLTEADRVWIRDNVTTGGAGAGVFIGTGAVSISNSTISNNVANGGAGIYATNTGFVAVLNSTIAGNSTPGLGGGILADDSSGVEISSSTIVGNTADTDDNGGGGGGGGLYNTASDAPFIGEFRIVNSIVADNKSGTAAPVQNQCEGASSFDSYGYNLLTTDDTFCIGFANPTDRFNPNPLLGPLAEGDLPTPTIALLAGSPAIDAGYTNIGPAPFVSPCPATDQRGQPRGGTAGPCDIGAFELQPPPPPPATPAKTRCKKGFRLKKVKTKKGKRKLKCVRKKRRRKK